MLSTKLTLAVKSNHKQSTLIFIITSKLKSYQFYVPVSYSFKRRPFLIPIIIMNGYNDITTEPADDEDFAIAYGYEIITEEELLDLLNSYGGSSPEPRQYAPAFTAGKRLGSFASSGVSSMMSKPMSSCSLSSQGTDISDDDDYLSSASSGIAGSHHGDEDGPHSDYDDDADGHQLSVENLWSVIQQRRYHEVELDHHQFPTMEQTSNSKKLTEWFSNLLHFPEKLRQIAADKHRFNINKVPKEVRDELKHIYVY
ncbi:hypothetical protein Ocin01_10526 [Orchesella cincta]|uniref:Uncharacterized protein n=1 Tax=Orchesella cincta TaxID=48709 RepID=A0A1D2MSY8_ORCCI|nr:hypothetical protein Ocin01_10526 [Orchesella cincta]